MNIILNLKDKYFRKNDLKKLAKKYDLLIMTHNYYCCYLRKNNFNKALESNYFYWCYLSLNKYDENLNYRECGINEKNADIIAIIPKGYKLEKEKTTIKALIANKDINIIARRNHKEHKLLWI